MSDRLAAIDAKLDQQAHAIADAVASNDLERESIMRLSRLVRYGHKTADLVVRRDGREHRFEVDWLCRMFRSKP